MTRYMVPVAVLLALAAPLAAKDSLGVYAGWAAFRDAGVPRCYAIAMPQPSQKERSLRPYATIGTWPQRKIRGQVHFRLSRAMREGRAISLKLGRKWFRLTGGGGDAWAADRKMDAAIVAAMRSASIMDIYATDARGRRFHDRYDLDGAASAMDAATIGCSRR